MKKLFLFLFFSAFNSHAVEANHYCAMVGTVYELASYARDGRRPPQVAFEMTNTFKELPDPLRKQIINQVYFDPVFRHTSGTSLRLVVYRTCLYGPPKPFTPM